MFKIKLGKYVVDAASGFEGVVEGRCLWNTGNIQYSVQPKIKEDKKPDSMWIDGDHLVIHEDPTNPNAIAEHKGVVSKYGHPNFLLDNGDEVKSTIFDFKGMVVGKIQWLNGCLEYSIAQKKLTKDHMIVYKTLAEEELELVKAKKVVTKQRNTGGPMSKVQKSERKA